MTVPKRAISSKARPPSQDDFHPETVLEGERIWGCLSSDDSVTMWWHVLVNSALGRLGRLVTTNEIARAT